MDMATALAELGVLACVAHVLGDFKLSSLNFRAARPGHGHQGPKPWPG